MVNAGTELTNYGRVKDIIEKMKPADGSNYHYFYILQMPRCGGSRIKIGKSKNLIQRLKYYQAHFHTSDITVLHLRRFSPNASRYIDGKSWELYSLFEREAIKALRNYNSQKISNGFGQMTEWFEPNHRINLLNTFKDFVEEFKKTDYLEIKQRKSERKKKEINYEEVDEDDKGKRVRKQPEKFKPS